MLTILTMAGKFRRMGMDAGYHGKPVGSCPTQIPWCKAAFMDGWKRGRDQRRLELADGSHPSLKSPPKPEPKRILKRRRASA